MEINYIDNSHYINTIKLDPLKRKIQNLLNENSYKGILAIRYIYAILLYSKYIIESKKLNYQEIFDGKLDTLIPYLNDYPKKYVDICIEYNLFRALKEIAFKPFDFYSYNYPFLDEYIDKNRKYVLIANIAPNYIKQTNVDISMGRKFPYISKYLVIQNYTYDKIRGIKRNYSINLEELNNYDEIIYINDFNYISYHEFINKYNIKIPILMVANYKNISTYKSNGNYYIDTELKEKLANVYIDNDKAYLYYVPEKKNSNIKIKKLSTNEEVVVSYQDIIDNNYRIGYRIYSKESNKEIDKTTIDIVEDNKRILTEISGLDNIINANIDKLIVK